MGSIPMPVDLQVINGNKNQDGKQFLMDRKSHEIVIGDCITKDTKPSNNLKKDKYACKKFSELINLFSTTGFSFVNTSHLGTIERYCVACSRLENLNHKREIIDNLINDVYKEKKVISNDALSMLTKIETKIVQLEQTLLKYERELYLSPISCVSNGIKKEKTHVSKLEKLGINI